LVGLFLELYAERLVRGQEREREKKDQTFSHYLTVEASERHPLIDREGYRDTPTTRRGKDVNSFIVFINPIPDQWVWWGS
jgi:hypothetical protein